MKKLVPVLYAASILLGSFCPMAIASAMQPSQPMEHGSQSEEVLMSPYMPMTLVAPMSVAPVVLHPSSLMAQAPGGCLGGSCFMVDHAREQATAISTANGDVQGGTALPAIIPSVVDVLSMPTPPPAIGGSHLANIITTIVLRV